MSNHEYSMPGYFQNMPVIGKALRTVNTENEKDLKKVEEEIRSLIQAAEDAGMFRK